MRNLILGFCCLAFASPAWAQVPGAIKDSYLVPINHGGHGHGGACADDCAAKVCVRVPAPPHTKTIFCSKCVEYCLPQCSLFGGGCNSCEDNCGPVRTKNVLLKKVVDHGCPTTKCEVSLGTGCASSGPRFGILHRYSGTVAAPPVEMIPTVPMKK